MAATFRVRSGEEGSHLCLELPPDDRNLDARGRTKTLEYATMAEGKRKNWRELCLAALDAQDPDELLEIAQELSRVLKSEEQLRRDFRNAQSANSSAGQARG